MEKLKNLPEIILVNTQLPENIGAVARSMLNFNFKKLKLVSPEFNLNHEKIFSDRGSGFVVVQCVVCKWTSESFKR